MTEFLVNLLKKFAVKKFLKGLLMVLAGLVALSYTLGYDYLFKGIWVTYLHGETSATIDDGKFFPSHTIVRGTPKPWVKDANYNKTKLPENILENLKDSKTAALVVIKNGKLLHEEYWNGYNANSRTNSFSMAKTVTTLLMGAAIADGKIDSENQYFSDFYKNYANVPYGNKLTLKDLSSMEAGLNWHENYKNPFSPNAKAYYGKSLGKSVLLKNFKENPGTKFEYQSGSTQLLGFAIRKAVNMPIASYASKKLWIPLGMEQNAEWSTDDFGMEKTFCCIQSDAKDFAKLGQLMLNNGKVDTLQIISPDFIQKMITPTKLSKNAYGMGLWINYDNPIKHYFFWGLLGQYIIVIPEKQMIIVRTGSYKYQPKNDNGRPDQVKFLVNELSKIF